MSDMHPPAPPGTPMPQLQGVDLILILIAQLRENLERIAADGVVTASQRTHVDLAFQKIDALEHLFVRLRRRPTNES